MPLLDRMGHGTMRIAFAVGGLSVGVVISLVLRAAPARSSPTDAPTPVHRATTEANAVTSPAASTGEPAAPPGVRAKLIGDSAGVRTYQLVLSPGTEAMGAIAEFVRANRIEAAHFEGLGACTDALLAYWDPAARDYHKTQYRQQMEVVSIIGDAAPTPGDGAGLHVHMGVALSDGTMRGGHLFETHVSPTMELVLTASPIAVKRHYDDTFHAWLLAP